MISETGGLAKILKTEFPQLAELALQEEIIKVGKIMHFKKGEVIMDFGSYVKLIPLVIHGTIKVIRQGEDHEDLLLYFLEKGQTCSMSFTCCMMNKRSQIRTVAEDDVTLIGIPIRYMDLWMSRYQSWKNFVMRTYDDRMVELVKTLDSIAFKQMDQRLLEYLEKKAAATQGTEILVTHQEIADDLNASREAVSRLLKKLEKAGKVKLGRNRVEIVE